MSWDGTEAHNGLGCLTSNPAPATRLRVPAIGVLLLFLPLPHFALDSDRLCLPKTPFFRNFRLPTTNGERRLSRSTPISSKGARKARRQRCCGSVAQIVAYPRASSLLPSQEICSSTGTSQSTPPSPPPSSTQPTNALFRSQFHPNDDSALSVLTYAVEHVHVEHGAPLELSQIENRISLILFTVLSRRCGPHPMRRLRGRMEQRC